MDDNSTPPRANLDALLAELRVRADRLARAQPVQKASAPAGGDAVAKALAPTPEKARAEGERVLAKAVEMFGRGEITAADLALLNATKIRLDEQR